jgi:putative transposase
MLSVVTDDAAHSELAMSLDELAREGARRMLAAALEAEVDTYIAAHAALTVGWTPRPGSACGSRA